MCGCVCVCVLVCVCRLSAAEDKCPRQMAAPSPPLPQPHLLLTGSSTYSLPSIFRRSLSFPSSVFNLSLRYSLSHSSLSLIKFSSIPHLSFSQVSFPPRPLPFLHLPFLPKLVSPSLSPCLSLSLYLHPRFSLSPSLSTSLAVFPPISQPLSIVFIISLSVSNLSPSVSLSSSPSLPHSLLLSIRTRVTDAGSWQINQEQGSRFSLSLPLPFSLAPPLAPSVRPVWPDSYL